MDENSCYSLSENTPYTECIQDVDEVSTQIRLDKTRLDKISIDKISKENRCKFGEFNHVLLKKSESDKLIQELGQDIFDKCIKKLDEYLEQTGKKYKNHNLAIRNWVITAVKENKSPKVKPKQNFTGREIDFDALEKKLLGNNN